MVQLYPRLWSVGHGNGYEKLSHSACFRVLRSSRMAVFFCRYGRQGVQLLLDGVIDYLPNPLEVPNYALDTGKDEEKVHAFPTFAQEIYMVRLFSPCTYRSTRKYQDGVVFIQIPQRTYGLRP